MSLNVRLPNALERELDEGCAAHSTTRSAAVKRALAQRHFRDQPAGWPLTGRGRRGNHVR
jgi:predicted transcriptional regulator